MKPEIQTVLPGLFPPLPEERKRDSGRVERSGGNIPGPVCSDEAGENGKHSLHIGNELVEYQINRSRRAKRMRIEVNLQGEIIVVAPSGTDLRAVIRFVQDNAGWIAESIRIYYRNDRDIRRYIEAGSRKIPYTISISKRAKRIILKVLSDKSVVLVVPPGVHPDKAHDFATGKADWIISKLDDTTRPAAPRRQFCDGEDFIILGKETRLSVRKNMPFFDIRLENQELIIHIPLGIPDSVLLHYTRKNIEFFLKNILHEVSSGMIRMWADRLGVCVPPVTYKNQKTRWGVCSRKGIILNIRLAMAPCDLIEYVVVHELCHIIQPNHSKAFWKLVAQMLPDYRERLFRLKREGGLFCL
jgi:predicted metal-dependent hydrolase